LNNRNHGIRPQTRIEKIRNQVTEIEGGAREAYARKEVSPTATVSASTSPVSPEVRAAAASGGHCAANGDMSVFSGRAIGADA